MRGLARHASEPFTLGLRFSGLRLLRLHLIALLALGSIFAGAALHVAPAHAATIYSYQAQPHGASQIQPKRTAVPRAPSGPPLSLGALSPEQNSAAAVPPSGEDALVGNGLGSPLCAAPGDLSASVRQSCETDDFIAAAYPTGDYAFDVNINTGIGALGNELSATTEDFLEDAWVTFVSVTHGLIVMFEWCYSLDLLSGSLFGEVTRALHGLRLSFTEPWLALVLSIGAVLAAYHGLLRRRVADTLGQALVMLAMMAGGLWVIADPAGTVGTLQQWADQASVGTLATVMSGSPSHPERTLADSMSTLFGGVVGAPWCYLEFGDVQWCRDSASFDTRLHVAALAIARREQTQSGCSSVCGPSAGAKDRTLAASALLLREARSNGALFLALPADESQRNSVTTTGTLLNVLCGRGESADKCIGPTAAQAEFRSEKGVQPRIVGICLISIGGLGMLLLFGFMALRLLTAALGTLFYLLLAPAAVLAPALGDSGRAAFRAWIARLLEAMLSKLVYSFVLGAALMLTNALLALTLLGWFAQWLLIASFWWGTFLKRRQLLGLIQLGTRHAGRGQHGHLIERRVVVARRSPVAELIRARRKRFANHDDISPRPLRAPPSAGGIYGDPSASRGEARAPRGDPGDPSDETEPKREPERDRAHGSQPTVTERDSSSNQPPLAPTDRRGDSSVLDDVRDLLAGRKQHLGLNPPQ